MSAWEELSSAYAEAAATSLPLHRCFTAAIGTIGSLAATNQTHKSIIETILRIQLSNFTAMDTPLLKDATLGNVTAGIAAAIAGLILSRLLLRIVFGLAKRSTSILQRAKTTSNVSTSQPIDPEHRKTEVDLLSSALERPRKRLRTYNSAVEIFASLSVLFFALAYWGNTLDALAASFFGLLALLLTVRSTQYFLSDYFGAAMVKAELEGRHPPSTEDVQ